MTAMKDDGDHERGTMVKDKVDHDGVEPWNKLYYHVAKVYDGRDLEIFRRGFCG